MEPEITFASWLSIITIIIAYQLGIWTGEELQRERRSHKK